MFYIFYKNGAFIETNRVKREDGSVVVWDISEKYNINDLKERISKMPYPKIIGFVDEKWEELKISNNIIFITPSDIYYDIINLLEDFDFLKSKALYGKVKDKIEKNRYQQQLKIYKKKHKAYNQEQIEQKIIEIQNDIYEKLEKFDFKGAKKIYNSNKNLIDKSWYIQIMNEKKHLKNECVQKDILWKLEEFNFKWAEELYNQNIDAIDNFWYKGTLKLYKKKLLHYQKNKTQRENSIKTILESLQKYNFSTADKIYKENQEILYNFDYKWNKKKWAKLYIESFLKEYAFKKADVTFSQQWDTLWISANEYIWLKKQYIRSFLNLSNKDELNDEKYDILTNNNNYMLIKARAWTGKTTLLKYKIKLLVDGYNIDPNKILAFAFNKKAAVHLQEETQKLWIKNFCSAMTFHSFAGRVITREKSNQQYEVIFDDDKSSNKNDQVLSMFVRKIFKDIDWNIHKKDLYAFFQKEVDEIDVIWQGLGIEDQYYHQRSYEAMTQNQTTLDGRRVKSKAEKWIADFLFEHGISYLYEYPASQSIIKDWTGLKRQIKPDFTLIDMSLHQEEWMIPIKKRDTIIEFWWRPWEEKYRMNMERKKRRYQERNKTLISLDITEIRYNEKNRRELFEDIIKQKLESYGIICEKLDFEKLFEKCRLKFIGDLTKKVISFIQRAKLNRIYPDDLQNILDKKWNIFSEKCQIFYKFALDIYKKYQEWLKTESKKDFSDLLYEAAECLQNNEDIKIKLNPNPITKEHNVCSIADFKYLLIDEYQDFSLLFHSLLMWIRRINPYINIICVWDDWQLINSFAWSKITYINEFKKYFSWSIEFPLAETNRCPRKIINISNKFMGWNWLWSKSKNNNIDWEIKWYVVHQFDNKDIRYKRIDIDWEKQYILYTTYIDIAKFFGKNYRSFEIMEIDENGENKQIILLPKENLEYAQYMKSLYDIFIKERAYIETFDLVTHNLKQNYENKPKHKDMLILYRDNKIFQKIKYRDESKDDLDMDDISDHLIFLLQEEIEDNFKVRKEINKELSDKIYNNLKELIKAKTIHQAKWLEAEIVVILGIWSGKYPSIHPDYELNAIFWETKKDVLDEERRLFYVALTRTKNKLYYISEKEITGNHSDFLLESRSDYNNIL